MTTKLHLPSMPFYGDDFFTSETVLSLREADQMVYLRLLWLNHKEGSIPADTKRLARIVGRSHASFLRAWNDGIADAFHPVEGEEGRLRNDRMARVMEDMAERSRANAENGRKGAEARWGKRRRGKSGGDSDGGGHGEANGDRHGGAIGEPMANGCPPTPSPTPKGQSSGSGRSNPKGPPADPDADPGDPGTELTGADAARFASLTRAGYGTPQERARASRELHDVHAEELDALWEAAQGRGRKPQRWFASIVRKGKGEVEKAIGFVRGASPAPAMAVALPPPPEPPRRPAAEVKAAAAAIQAVLADVGHPGSPKEQRDVCRQLAEQGTDAGEVRELWDRSVGLTGEKGAQRWFRRELESRIRLGTGTVIPMRRPGVADPGFPPVFGEEAAHG